MTYDNFGFNVGDGGKGVTLLRPPSNILCYISRGVRRAGDVKFDELKFRSKGNGLPVTQTIFQYSVGKVHFTIILLKSYSAVFRSEK